MLTRSAVEAWLAPRADEMAELLTRLIAIDSENPPGRELGRCARAVHEAMDVLGLGPDIVELAPARELEEPSIVRGSVGDGPKLLYFHGHFDVVPAQDRRQFTAERRDGKIIGRGSADMKGGIVSMLYGAAAARDLGLLGDGRIVLHLVCDEETGSVTAAGHLREAKLIDPRALAMVTAEPSGGKIWNSARGALSLRVEVRGLEAHVGQADRGVNAFQHMLHIARPVENYAREMTAKGSRLVVGGLFGGGSNFNVVPGSAFFTVDGRYDPDEDLDRELDHLTAAVKEAAAEIGAKVSIEVTQRQPPAHTDASHSAATALAEVVAEVEGEARFEMCAGILETRWYSQLGIPAFGYGAGRLEVAHGPDEYVDEAAMRRCSAVYALYAGRMFAA
ncbi:M20/M25/M40 family metallo-hydrolase [Allokutzneria sp. A3M-2-11 16]|uniref:M20/M25/M40 family metallo-hydrolase n=1 Tax=Allokutzneria sp. A3M-2-11 16 TaxID=2962043 RepID=UPI0020B6F374|nr:M20/M25/M40 family metallo-hydrolase [Allokutzneria sp. A3M-2-11 16]MCP3798391.1 M20/M25/M40 family metallo-hydrolase [Allokutzneria sp. A3M-2-11 16]